LVYGLHHQRLSLLRLVQLEVLVRNYLIPKALDVYVLTDDRVVGFIKCDAIISLLEYEVLISDALAEELGIVILALRTGLWRFKDENKVRTSEAPLYWF
jgi:hypothetical protein